MTRNLRISPATLLVTIALFANTAAQTKTPVKIGTTIAGTFKDGTGHSGQSHLVYAPNAGVWWLFTLSSAHDSLSDRTVQAYVSSGPNLGTATWTAATSSPNLANAGGATSSLLAGGRSLGVALRTIGTTDYVHVFASAAFDGQVSSNGHVRARLGPTSIAWEAWDNPGSPNAASEWQGPPGTGASSASSKTPWGNSVGISTGGFIHHFSVVMDQEVDCAVGRSKLPDTTATWTNGFGNNISPTGVSGVTSPPNTTAVIDKTMTFECKALAFAPLANDVMLAVYSNGAVAQPNLTNLRYQRSGATGTWTNMEFNGTGGDGTVFGTSTTINQNDWALVPVTTSTIYAFRRNGTAVNGASYNAATNTWAAMSPAPPAFGAGQSFKATAGIFGATDGTNLWLFVINGATSDAANSILFTKFNGSSWTAWSAVPGTNAGLQTRSSITGYLKPGSGQIGLAWMQGTTTVDTFVTSLDVAPVTPTAVTITAPASGSTVFDTTTVSATVTGSASIAGVQFQLDGTNLQAEDTTSPYSISWDTTQAANGAHNIGAVARDTTGVLTSATPVTVKVANLSTPIITWPPPAPIEYGTPLGPVQLNATANTPGTFTYSPPAGTILGFGKQALSLVFSPNDTLNFTSANATNLIAVNDTTPPALTLPTDVTIDAFGPSGAVYNFTATASDLLDGPVPVTCTPASGFTFPIGTTAVACSASDVHANTASGGFAVTVRKALTRPFMDILAPAITVPADITVMATTEAGAIVTYDASAVDNVDGTVAVTCAPPSGSLFPVGSTTVICTATDAAGNSAASAFVVAVLPPPPNHAPVAMPAAYRIESQTVLTGVLNASDPDGNALTFEIVENGEKGTAVVNPATGVFTYTPTRRGAGGRDRFTFRVSDGRILSNVATIDVRMNEGTDQ